MDDARRLDVVLDRIETSVRRFTTRLVEDAHQQRLDRTDAVLLERQLRQLERERRRLWRRRRGRRTSGLALGLIAGALAAMAYGGGGQPDPQLLWIAGILGVAALLRFVAAAKHRGERTADRAEEREEPLPAARSAPIDPRAQRVDAICDRLLAELAGAPKPVRELLRRPEQTVTSLREACAALRSREQALRASVNEAEAARLSEERAALARQIAAETDPITRERLEQALGLLDRQRAERAELRTAADRLAAEHTRLLYSLEGMHTQLLKVKSADAANKDLAGAGLRIALDRWTEELSAVADALEAVHAEGVSDPVRLEQPPSALPDRQRA